MIKNSPLQLDGCYFTIVKIVANPNADGKAKVRVEPEVLTEVGPLGENRREWYVQLKIKIVSTAEVQAPYHGEIEVFATFTVAPDWSPEGFEKLVYINGSGMVYAAAREMICSITARGFYDMYVLPSVSFSQMYTEKNLKGVAAPSSDSEIKPS